MICAERGQVTGIPSIARLLPVAHKVPGVLGSSWLRVQEMVGLPLRVAVRTVIIASMFGPMIAWMRLSTCWRVG